jgi:hypothetical protein
MPKESTPMSLPIAERDNPRDIATGAAISGQFHDVVMSVSKVLHGKKLEPEDLEVLRWARKMLSSAGSARIASMPSAKELSNQASSISFLRRAAQPTAGNDPDRVFKELSKNLGDVLQGKRNEDLIESLTSIRTIFSMVSQISLGSNIAKKSEQDPIQTWRDLTTTTLSS